MNGARLLLLAGLGWSALAHAQPLLADDFENRTSPFGAPWDSSTTDEGTLTLEAAAAHRGTQGLRFVDTNDAGTSGYGTALVHDMLPRVDGGMWTRFWFRTTRLDSTGSMVVLMMGASAGGAAARQQQLTHYDGTLGAGGFTVTGFTYRTRGRIDAGWHLLEFGAEGLGTTTGRRELFVDGSSFLVSTENFGWAQPFDHELRLGGAYATERDFLGVLDFDDVRLSTTIPPSTVALVVPDGGIAGACSNAELWLATSRGTAVAVADTTFTATLAVSGGTVHAGANCSGSGTFRIDAGTSAPWRVSWRVASAGTATFSSSADDFLPTQTVVTVRLPVDGGVDAGVDAGGVDAGSPDAGAADAGTSDAGTSDAGALDAGALDASTPDAGAPDAGTPDAPTPGAYDVGCGCTGAPGFWLVALGALMLRGRRKERP